MQNDVFHFHAACTCPVCLYGSAVKIALCHAQSINSPITMCVNFWPPNPPIISQNPTQAEKCQLTTYTKSVMMKPMAVISLN